MVATKNIHKIEIPDLFKQSGARWIWPEESTRLSNQYVEFRHEFFLESFLEDENVSLIIASECNYVAWINSDFVGTGQFPNQLNSKSCDQISVELFLKSGRNVLTVWANHWGENNFSYIPDVPGLIYAFSGERAGHVASGEGVLCRTSAGYRQGTFARLTPQLPATFEYDASKNDEWIQKDYVPDGQWRVITKNDIRHCDGDCFFSRPVEKCSILPRVTSMLVAQGEFMRPVIGANKTVAQQMQTDFFSPRKVCGLFNNISDEYARIDLNDREMLLLSQHAVESDGVYLILDMGREEAGYFDLEIEASEGTVIEIAYGEHLDDMRVRSSIGDRNFSGRYICAEGRQQFTHYFSRIAGRYLQLQVSHLGDHFALYYAGLLPVEYPINFSGTFCSSDNLQNKIYEVAVRTLHLCMHDHYEDSPWREQALYSNDMRNQALCGYCCFGDYDFSRISLKLLADSLREDGFLELCAPAEIPITIPSFSMVWILALQDYLLYSGDVKFIEDMLPTVWKILDTSISRLSEDLLPVPSGDQYWHFYDWSDGLNGLSEDAGFGADEMQRITGSWVDAPYNLFFCLALDAAVFMAKSCGQTSRTSEYEEHSLKIKKAVHQTFWNAESAGYQTYLKDKDPGHFAELTQSLAICAGACPEELLDPLAHRLALKENDWVNATLSQAMYKYEALLKADKEQFGREVLNRINAVWGDMLFSGASSFWETEAGGWDFDGAGSLCHGWSAIPVYFFNAYLLGVKPLSPGFAEFSVCLIEEGRQRSGVVPTPYGPIYISWKWEANRFSCRLVHPKETSAVFLGNIDSIHESYNS